MGGFFPTPHDEGKIRAKNRSSKKHRVEGQHLRTNRNHQRNALNSVSHVSFPAKVLFYVPFGEGAYAPVLLL